MHEFSYLMYTYLYIVYIVDFLHFAVIVGNIFFRKILQHQFYNAKCNLFFIVVFFSFRNFNIKSTSGCKKNSRFGVRNINVLPSPFVPYPVWSVIPYKKI